MSSLAALGEASAPPDEFEKAAWEIIGADREAMANTSADIKALIQAHALEWRMFRQQFDAHGFLNKQEEE
jgi:hypothetical protein